MDDQLWQRADDLLCAALDLPADERDAFLEKAAAGEEELAALARRLLRNAETSDEEDFVPGLRLSTPLALHLFGSEEIPSDKDDTAHRGDDPPATLPPGSQIGRYRLLHELGRGGMAVVYQAERMDGDFEQQVALKRIRGANSQELVQRFEQERQILARATHPDIARLLDGGVDDDGHPFLVMELVDGVPIDSYCDRERLTVEERLRLFLRVAQAVQYAHRNLVIHRDIKPSNILVTDDGHPKLLDFGIARLLDDPQGARGANLTQELRPMTPAYASPEQVRREPVSTLSDLYQLGLLLYLLLTGRTPYRWQSSRSPLDLARAITEEPPAQPHVAFLDLGDEGSPSSNEPSATRQNDTRKTAETIAHQRQASPTQLARQLRGDLGQVVLMSLRKEPERRYPSVALMIDDIERYLAGRTVAARPDSAWYRFRTFARRHRVAVQIAALLLISLVAFSAVTAVQSHRIAAERDRANREAEISGAVSSSLTDLFQLFDPSETRGNTVTAREILDRGSAEIDLRMPEPTPARARLKRSVGKVYENLGLYQEALPLYRQALATARETGGPEDANTVDAQADLARLLMRLAQYEEAEALTRSALAARQQRLGTEDPKTLDLEANLASLDFFEGRRQEAETTLRRILEIRRRTQGNDHLKTLATATTLAATLFNQGRLSEAEVFYREILEGLTRLQGADHPQTLKAASNLGSIWVQLERFEEAEPLLRSTIEGRRRVLGDDHPATYSVQTNLAGLLADRGQLDEAENLYRQIHAGLQRVLGPQHPRTVTALYDLAWVVSLTPSRRPQAIDLYTEVLAGYESTFEPEHPNIVDTLYTLAVVEAQTGRTSAALVHLATAVDRGYGKAALLEEPAFEALAQSPEMARIRAAVQASLQ